VCKKKLWVIGICVILLLPLLFIWGCRPVEKAEGPTGEPIIIGSPLPVAFSYGWVAERGIRLAVEEINAAGGVNVGGVMRPLQVEVIDTRDLEAGACPYCRGICVT